ncbi:MAG: M23 family metallopeptidase [Patescibacteria group bacterium]|jgi:murein DD-endopeptidase MepM/ murein hydrolase activator NlpD
MRKIFFVIVLVLLLSSVLYLLFHKKAIAPTLPSGQTNNNQIVTSTPIKINETVEPIAQALSRVTKKPFGIKISIKDSPVQPERFSGYHTGVDFETTEAEQNIDVPIYAICSGPLVLKKYATGYGGVAVQSCEINKKTVTVIYGHLQLASISAKVNQELKAGDQLGILGKEYSTETDGERKHLHLGIHYGEQVALLGYVQKQSELSAWMDVAKLFVK